MRWESWMDSPLFAGMGRDALCSLLRRLPWTRRHYARGDTVCEAGAGVEALGLVAAWNVYIESCDAWGGRSLLGAVGAGPGRHAPISRRRRRVNSQWQRPDIRPEGQRGAGGRGRART